MKYLTPEIAEKTIQVFGLPAQLDMVKEESAELILAVSHYERGRITREQVLEEMADTRIMQDQLEHVLKSNDAEIDAIVARKLARFKTRLEAGNAYFKPPVV